MSDSVQEIMAKPYMRSIQPDGEAWFGQVLEFPGCFSSGFTAEEALKNLEGVMESWLLSSIAQGQSIPAPFDSGDARAARNIRQAMGRDGMKG